MQVEKNDAIKISASIKRSQYLSVGNCFLFLLVPPDSVECGGLSCNWQRQTQPKPFLSQEFVK
jgi:hypothetical protein